MHFASQPEAVRGSFWELVTITSNTLLAIKQYIIFTVTDEKTETSETSSNFIPGDRAGQKGSLSPKRNPFKLWAERKYHVLGSYCAPGAERGFIHAIQMKS